jgi:uncharacterized protein with HEPN domain
MSAPRDDGVYLGHIRDSIARIESYTAGISEAEFLNTPMVQDAVIHQIQILGEAANRLSADFQQRVSSIPWRDIIGMRNKLVHDYMGVDLGAVWHTVVRDIPALRAELERVV